jgi:hypothetical protein
MNTLNFDLQLFADGDAGGAGAGDGAAAGTTAAGSDGTAQQTTQAGQQTQQPATQNQQTQTQTQTGTILGGDPKPNNQNNPQNNAQNQQPTVPESYDFAAIIPEGMQQDAQSTQEFSEIAKKCGLSQEQASEIAKYGIDFSQHAIQQINQEYNQRVTGWADQTKQELGNDYDAVVSNAGKGIEALEKQIPGLRQALNETGVGNRVELVKAFSLLGQLVGEDNFRGFTGIVPQKDNLYENTDFSKYGS